MAKLDIKLFAAMGLSFLLGYFSSNMIQDLGLTLRMNNFEKTLNELHQKVFGEKVYIPSVDNKSYNERRLEGLEEVLDGLDIEVSGANKVSDFYDDSQNLYKINNIGKEDSVYAKVTENGDEVNYDIFFKRFLEKDENGKRLYENKETFLFKAVYQKDE